MTFTTFFLNINSSTELLYMSIRTIIVFIFAIFLIRFGDRRVRINTPLDFVLIFIIGSILGRTIYGETSLIATCFASILLVLMHNVFAKLAYRYKLFGKIIKGGAILLVKDGQLCHDEMAQNAISENDLIVECRRKINTSDLTSVKEARLERTGNITFIKKE